MMPLSSQCLMMMIETLFGSCQRAEAQCSLVLPKGLINWVLHKGSEYALLPDKNASWLTHTVVSDPKLLKNLIGLVYKPIRNLIGFNSQTNKTLLV